MTKYIIISILLLSSIFLLGCTSSDMVIPVTESQVLFQSTCIDSMADLNNYREGYFDGNLVYVDSNKLCFISPKDMNFLDANIPWSTLIEFPPGCADGEVVKIVGSSLVCVAQTTDTNIYTAGVLDDSNFV